MRTELLLRLESVRKAYGATVALRDARMDVAAGQVHALIGENGAGKSTLMKVLAGAVQPDGGSIRWKGREVAFQSPAEATRQGISMIHQELSLVPRLSIAENIFLGNWPRVAGCWLDREAMKRTAMEALKQAGLDSPPETPAIRLSLAEMQQVEIARALSHRADLIVMDEPTSSLSAPEIDRLFEIIGELTQRNVAVIYISHRLEEVETLAHHVTILRDGETVSSSSAQDISRTRMIQLMAGRDFRQHQRRSPPGPKTEFFRAESVSVSPRVRNVSFTVGKGEVVGLAGLVGAGRTELVKAIFGALPLTSGQLYLQGRPIQISSPLEAVRLGMGYVPEDRRHSGLVSGASLWNNMVLAAPGKHSRWGFFNAERELEDVGGLIEDLSIRTSGPLAPVGELSGGNQQKVVLGRWLYASIRFLILDEPTRGVDVAAKAQVYGLIDRLARKGLSILLVSSEMPEVLSLSDRILVMREGVLAGELTADEADQESILALAMGVTT